MKFISLYPRETIPTRKAFLFARPPLLTETHLNVQRHKILQKCESDLTDLTLAIEDTDDRDDEDEDDSS